jgi:hypothetical protein
MPGVKCPECGERVKYRADDVKLRCPECGEKFRVPDGGGEEDRPRRKKKTAKKSLNKVVFAVVGGLVGIALCALVVVLLVRDKGKDGGGGGGGETATADVSSEKFKQVHPAMTTGEVEKILGKGGTSSLQDFLAVWVRKDGPHKGKLIAGQDPIPPDCPMEWRRWDGRGVRIWIAFRNTRHGPLAAFGVCSDSSGKEYNGRTFTHRTEGLDQLLEDAYSTRMQSTDIRKDAKWVRGAKGQALVLGDWRDADCKGMLIEAAGKMRTRDDVPQPKDPNRLPVYRFVNDNQIEITHRFYGRDDVSLHDFFVSQEELVLIDVTPNVPHDFKAKVYYRMPPKPGGLADTKVLQPLIADAKNPDFNKHVPASGKLIRLGKYGLPALRELERTSTEPLKGHFQFSIQIAEARAAEEEKN